MRNMMADMKTECQHIVYGTGHRSFVPRTYMAGLISGQTFGIGIKNMSEFALSSRILLPILERACKEALSDNSSDNFRLKFQRGVSVTIDKRYEKMRTIK